MKLIDLSFRVAAAPGDQQIGLQRDDALKVHALPVGDLLKLTRRVGVIGISAHRNGRNAGGKGEFGIGGRESDDARRGAEPRREKKQGDQRPVKPTLSHGSGS
ncbi:hypothetical protein BN133_1358 [Cronobacter dublinensis 582]|nr:hypothetical protein BN133_1358 [Cronobacter dublinensis 582]